MKSLVTLIREYGRAREHFGWQDCQSKMNEEDLGKDGEREMEKDRKRAEAEVAKAWKALASTLEIATND